MGQSDPRGRHQGGVIRAILAKYSVTPVQRMRPDHRCGLEISSAAGSALRKIDIYLRARRTRPVRMCYP